MSDTLIVFTISCLTYASGVAFYHSHVSRSALSLPATSLRALRLAAWLTLLSGFGLAVSVYSWQLGIFIHLFLASILFLVSLLLASRWPLAHARSGLIVTLAIPAMAIA
ncbi:MAG: hypothetical protein AAGI11_14725 [Pseudomonadota bacterium]